MAGHGNLIARVERRNKLPKGIIAGIANAETGLGRAGKGPALHNFWGWMDSRGAPHQRSFPNTQAAIRQYGRFLSQNYVSQGLRTPEQIGGKYVIGNPAAPAPSGWVSNVHKIMGQFGGGIPPATVLGANRTPANRRPGGPGKALTAERKLIVLSLLQTAAGSGMEMNRLLPVLQILASKMGTAGRPRRTRNPAAANDIPINPTVVAGRGALRLPASFSATHDTDGLPGYPAHDFMSAPGKSVGAPASGRVIKVSGSNSWKSGGIGGRSVYIKTKNGTYFLTHFAPNLTVKVGDRVRAGQIIGYVGNPTSGMAPHIHIGLNSSLKL